MTVLGIASAASPYQPGATNRAAEGRQAFKELGTALSAGDLATAQQAFDTLQQNLPGAGRSKGQKSDPARELIRDLGSALESGNLADAQQIMAKLQQGMGEIRGNHYGREKRAARQEEAAGATQPAAPTVETYSSGGLPVTTATTQAPAEGAGPGEIDIQA